MMGQAQFGSTIHETDLRERFHGAVAQLGEHRLCKPRVAGSIPVRSTKVHSRSKCSIGRARRQVID